MVAPLNKDHWPALAIIVTVVIALGAGEWTISGLAERTRANETEIIDLRAELGQLLRDQSSFQGEMRSNNTLTMHQIDGLQAGLDALKPTSGLGPALRRR